MAYDSRCFDLAEHFLQDVNKPTEFEKADLAQVIQNAIDDWMAENIGQMRRIT